MHTIFADTDDTRAWFDYLETVPEADADRIEIPPADTWREWLQYVEVPEEDLEDVIASTPTETDAPDLYRILQKGAAGLVSAMGQVESPPRFAALKDFSDPDHRFFYVQLLTACLPHVRAYHASLGIPEQITQATVADLGRNIRVHRKREGVGGLGVMWWLMLHFRGVIFQLGRLQFECRHAGDDIATSMRTHGLVADASTNVLSIHIPDFSGPMDHEACTASIAQAAEFFPTYLPNWQVSVAICNSWLLDPQMKAFLKPESNIIRFQDRFELVDQRWDASESVMQFVFGKHVDDVESITPHSSLERGVIDHLKSGGKFESRAGWFALPH